MIRQLWTGVVTTVALAVLGLPVGLLWESIAPRPTFIIAAGTTVMADPESQAFIAGDGWYTVLTGVAGLLCGLLGYLSVGRLQRRVGELGLVLGLTAGGLSGALLTWWVGHAVGSAGFDELVRRGQEGMSVTGGVDLRSTAAVLVWPLAAVMVFGLLEALDVANRNPVATPASPAPRAPQASVPPGETGAAADTRAEDGARAGGDAAADGPTAGADHPAGEGAGSTAAGSGAAGGGAAQRDRAAQDDGPARSDGSADVRGGAANADAGSGRTGDGPGRGGGPAPDPGG